MQTRAHQGRVVTPKRSRMPLFYALLGGIAILGVALILFATRQPELPASDVPLDSAVRPLNAPIGRTPEGFATKGAPEAPVKLVVYADFQCPACATAFELLEGTIDQRYVESGNVQVIFHDFPLPQHDNAIPTALAARCAGEQNAFWPMHDLLFSRQKEWSADRNSTPRLHSYAGQLGLDRDEFSNCLSEAAYTPALQQAARDAEAQGVNATPTYLVDGNLVSAMELEAAIEAALATQGG